MIQRPTGRQQPLPQTSFTSSLLTCPANNNTRPCLAGDSFSSILPEKRIGNGTPSSTKPSLAAALELVICHQRRTEQKTGKEGPHDPHLLALPVDASTNQSINQNQLSGLVAGCHDHPVWARNRAPRHRSLLIRSRRDIGALARTPGRIFIHRFRHELVVRSRRTRPRVLLASCGWLTRPAPRIKPHCSCPPERGRRGRLCFRHPPPAALPSAKTIPRAEPQAGWLDGRTDDQEDASRPIKSSCERVREVTNERGSFARKKHHVPCGRRVHYTDPSEMENFMRILCAPASSRATSKADPKVDRRVSESSVCARTVVGSWRVRVPREKKFHEVTNA